MKGKNRIEVFTEPTNGKKINEAPNPRFAKTGVWCFCDSKVLNSSFVHLIKCSAEKSRLREAEKRYAQYKSTSMSKIELRLKELGFDLPDLPEPIANYIPDKRTGNLILTAGQVSVYDGKSHKENLDMTLV